MSISQFVSKGFGRKECGMPLVELRCSTKKLYSFAVGQMLFKKSVLLTASYVSAYCESACRDKMIREISIPKQQLNNLRLLSAHLAHSSDQCTSRSASFRKV